VETPHVKRLEKSQGRSTGDAHLEWTREPYFPPAHTPPMPAPPPDTHDRFSLDNYERGRISTCWLNILNDGFGEWVRIPLIVARGVEVRCPSLPSLSLSHVFSHDTFLSPSLLS
jgi:hypothetical protein